MFLRSIARLPFIAVRRLRWRMGAWSKDSDRSYHEQLYATQDYDPFRLEYPGYVTIRRFADHVEPLLPASGTVLDVGCGPGEITCELARRHPALTFVGIDHSVQAIERAQRHAARLGLTNIRFSAGDAERLPADERYGLVTMFDAFHHLERPREFVAWLQARTSRCVLIEPAGTWSGRWARGLDVDWLLFDLANVRDRLEAMIGDRTNGPAAGGTSQNGPPRGEGAVERRYALADFERFFSGWQLRVTGTIAGFEAYPPGPHDRSPLRPIAGDLAYALVRATEEVLQQRDLDGAAKHWVIAATTEAGLLHPRLPRTSPMVTPEEDLPRRTVASAFDVRYQAYDGPVRISAGARLRATIEIVNAGWDEWRSEGQTPVRVSYHWLNRAGQIVEFDGLRSDLPRPIGPGDTCRAFVAIAAPPTPGAYLLAIDLVKEGVTWFSEAGLPWHTVEIHVERASEPAAG